jgi:hypothetical protein
VSECVFYVISVCHYHVSTYIITVINGDNRATILYKEFTITCKTASIVCSCLKIHSNLLPVV